MGTGEAVDMKIVATIADDRTPQGWEERFTALTHDTDETAARKQVERIATSFNACLRGHELPRRIQAVRDLRWPHDAAIAAGMV